MSDRPQQDAAETFEKWSRQMQAQVNEATSCEDLNNRVDRVDAQVDELTGWLRKLG